MNEDPIPPGIRKAMDDYARMTANVRVIDVPGGVIDAHASLDKLGVGSLRDALAAFSKKASMDGALAATANLGVVRMSEGLPSIVDGLRLAQQASDVVQKFQVSVPPRFLDSLIGTLPAEESEPLPAVVPVERERDGLDELIDSWRELKVSLDAQNANRDSERQADRRLMIRTVIASNIVTVIATVAQIAGAEGALKVLKLIMERAPDLWP